MSKSKFFLWVVFCALLAGCLVAWHAWVKAPTYDEPGHLGIGHYHWQTLDFFRGLEHPPLLRLWAAWPLEWLRITDPQALFPPLQNKPLSVSQENLYGLLLLYESPTPAHSILFSARLMMGLILMAFILFVAFWSRENHGSVAGAVIAFLLASSPAFLGHGGLIMTDLGGSFFAVLFIYCTARALQFPSRKNWFFCGLALGLALSSKLSNILLVPFFVFAFLLWEKKLSLKEKLLAFGSVLLTSALVVNVCYGFQDFFPPHFLHPDEIRAYAWPRWLQSLYTVLPLPDFFLKSLAFAAYHARTGFVAAYLGHLESGRIYSYLPLVLAAKMTTAVFFAMIFAGIGLFAKKLTLSEKCALLALLFFSGTAEFARLHAGIRHLLTVSALLIFLSGSFFQKLWNEWNLTPKAKASILVLFLLAQATELALCAPHFLTFNSWLVGGSAAGGKLFSDGDLGQDLQALGRWLKNPENQKARVLLSYFGTAIPQAHGIAAEELAPTGSLVASHYAVEKSTEPLYLAVSLNQMLGLSRAGQKFGWLQNLHPIQSFGGSIFVFDISQDAESLAQIAAIYRQLKNEKRAIFFESEAKRLTGR